MADFPIKDIPIGETQHCPNCETQAREAERWRVRAEQYSAGWDAMGTKAQALVDQLSAENERLREALREARGSLYQCFRSSRDDALESHPDWAEHIADIHFEAATALAKIDAALEQSK